MFPTQPAGYRSAGLTQLSYQLPSTPRDLGELAAAGLLHSDPQTLAAFGFATSYAFEQNEFEEQLVRVGRDALQQSDMDTETVDWLLVYTGLPLPAASGDDPLRLFRYPASRVHHELGLTNARVLALSQQGCSGLLASMDLARRLLQSEEHGVALCLAGDMLPKGAKREIMYNLMSDAVGAAVVQTRAKVNRILTYFELRQTYYWDPSCHPEELLAAYFPLAQRCIQQCLASAGLTADQIRWFVPHNVSARSWDILARLIGVPSERIWMKNISRLGHTVTCDHIMNLSDMAEQGALAPGDLLLLFTFGFGATWSCLLLER
jgi:3-oxoacyl-[acyl-carrier-protein] synthase III